MALRKAPPGGGGEPRHVHFRYVSTGQGQKWPAYMAGPVHWFVTHELKRTKPCVEYMTSGELSCTYCEASKPKRTLGYVPLYRQEDGLPCMVIVYDGAREELDRLTLHTRVLVGRSLGRNDTVYVLRAAAHEPVYQSRLAERNVPVDLSITLLRIWQIPELSDWYARTEQEPVPEPLPKPEKPSESVADAILNGKHGTLRQWTEFALGTEAEKVQALKKNAATVDSWKQASANGTHKPKPKG